MAREMEECDDRGSTRCLSWRRGDLGRSSLKEAMAKLSGLAVGVRAEQKREIDEFVVEVLFRFPIPEARLVDNTD